MSNDTAARNRKALAMLVDLLELPRQRPGAWEAEHVEALEVEHLAPIVDVLTGADREVEVTRLP